MKIVIIGGSGLIGKKLVERLQGRGHEAVSASPSSGVNAKTGEGLEAALRGADVVVDVSNAPSFERHAVLDFFETSGKNIAAAEKATGVKQHVALSIVGTDRLPNNGYFCAKVAQENLIKSSGIPFTIVRATQFLEFLGAIADSSEAGPEGIRLSTAKFQPIAADDVADAMTRAVLSGPTNDTIDIAGPEKAPFYEVIDRYLRATGDSRKVVPDADALYFGDRLDEGSLVPHGPFRKGALSLDEWLSRRAA